MSKIEEYQEAKRVADRVTRNYQKAAGLDSTANDKHHIDCRFLNMVSTQPFTPAMMDFRALYGYYGNSSSYSAMDEATARYVAKAITDLGVPIMKRAAYLAAQDAERARQAAEDEARAVLEEVATPRNREGETS